MTSIATLSTSNNNNNHHQQQQQQILYYLFGLPATGKSHIGRMLENKFGFQYYDADKWLPNDLLESLKQGNGFTPEQRDRYYSHICDKITEIISQNNNKNKVPIVIAQATFKNKHRLHILKRFPYINLVWIQTSMEVRLKRLNQRNDTNDGKDDGNNDTTTLAAGSKAATAEWCENNDKKFEIPNDHIKHTVFVNDTYGTNSNDILYKDLIEMFEHNELNGIRNNSNNNNHVFNVLPPPSKLTRVRSYSGSVDKDHNFDVGTALGIDIGGSLAKLVIFEPKETKNSM